ncbi:2504_t:CDS:2, partial [Gigaspora margarita]
YISVHPLSNIGEWNNFSPAYLNKLWNVLLHRPNPTKSEYTIPSSTWTIPINDVNDYEEGNINVDQGDKSKSQKEIINNPLVVISIPSMVDVEFLLTKGWVLKDNQKLDNRDSGNKLLKYVEAGDIEAEDISKTSTIQNWLNTYACAFKQRATIESND